LIVNALTVMEYPRGMYLLPYKTVICTGVKRFQSCIQPTPGQVSYNREVKANVYKTRGTKSHSANTLRASSSL